MILCCGEALIDMIPGPQVGGGEGFVPHSGGAIFNTAIGLGRLGVPTGFLTGLSTDLFGQQLATDLERSHVDAGFSIRSDLPTTLAFVRLNEGHATYTFYDENTAGRSLSPEMCPTLPDSVAALYFGGISLISEPCADFYAALATAEQGNRVIMLDPNIRASFIKNEARYRQRLEGMIQAADIVKVSDEDLDWIVPGDDSLDAKAQSFLSQGASAVIVTKGREGAVGYSVNGDPVVVPAQKVSVVDTVGAGDTFNAGVLAYFQANDLLRKEVLMHIPSKSMEAALAYGARVAAITVSRAGANPPWAREL